MRYSTLFDFTQHTSDCASWIARSLPGDSIAVSAMVYASKEMNTSKFAERKKQFRLERWEACSGAAVIMTSKFTSYDLASHRDPTQQRHHCPTWIAQSLLCSFSTLLISLFCSSLPCSFFSLFVAQSSYFVYSVFCSFSALLDCISLLGFLLHFKWNPSEV